MSSFNNDLIEEKEDNAAILKLQKANSDIEIASQTKEGEIKLAVSQALAENSNQLETNFALEKQALEEQNKALQRSIDGLKAKGMSKSHNYWVRLVKYTSKIN